MKVTLIVYEVHLATYEVDVDNQQTAINKALEGGFEDQTPINLDYLAVADRYGGIDRITRRDLRGV